MPRKAKALAPEAVELVQTAVAPTPEFVLTPEEIAAVRAAREKVAVPGVSALGAEDLIKAFITAIESTRPFQKKTIMDRKRRNPWTPTDGSAKITKFKRTMYHHGLELDPQRTYNDVCLMLDKVKPGVYCDGYVKVAKRRDGSINIDYPIKTNSQRLRLSSQYGIRSFRELIQRLLDERANPIKYKPVDEDDD